MMASNDDCLVEMDIGTCGELGPDNMNEKTCGDLTWPNRDNHANQSNDDSGYAHLSACARCGLGLWLNSEPALARGMLRVWRATATRSVPIKRNVAVPGSGTAVRLTTSMNPPEHTPLGVKLRVSGPSTDDVKVAEKTPHGVP